METAAKLGQLADRVGMGIFFYLVAVCLINFVAHTTSDEFLCFVREDPMRAYTVGICVTPFVFARYPAVWWWIYRVAMATVAIEAVYLFTLASPLAIAQGEIDNWIWARYAGYILAPVLFLGEWDVVSQPVRRRAVHFQASPSS